MTQVDDEKYKTYRLVLDLKVRNSFNFNIEDFLAFVRHRLNLQGFMLIGKLLWCGEVTGTSSEFKNDNRKEVVV